MGLRYVIIGAGAVGATLAAQFVGADIPVVVVARGANLAALRTHGLRYIRPDGEHQVKLDVAAGPEEVDLRAGDVLVLATKSQDAETLLATWAWRPIAGARPGTGAAPGEPAVAAEALPVVLPQNGLDSSRSALRRFATVIDAVAVIPASHLRPGEVVSPGAPQVGGFVVGLADGAAARRAPHDLLRRVAGTRSPFAARPGGELSWLRPGERMVERVAADLRRASFAATVVDDIARYKAGKLLDNLANNLDAAFGPSPLRDAVAVAVVDEARAVFTAAGIRAIDPLRAPGLNLGGWSVKEIPGHPRSGSSTWQSLARGGSVESDYLNGEIVLLARLHGLDAPVNAALARWIATAASTGAEPESFGDAQLADILTAAGRPLPSAVEIAARAHIAAARAYLRKQVRAQLVIAPHTLRSAPSVLTAVRSSLSGRRRG